MDTGQDRQIDYVEFGAPDLAAVQRFYEQVFGWRFQSWGDDYVSFEDGRLSGGFTTRRSPGGGGPLVIMFADDLEAMQRLVEEAGGVITRAIFSFPGGRRFHFTDPAGNELAVWAEP